VRAGDPRGIGSRVCGEARLEREVKMTRNGGKVVEHVGFVGAPRPSRGRKCSVPRLGDRLAAAIPSVWAV